MKTNILHTILIGLIATACSAPSGNMQLQQEVIAVHDSIMPKMGTFVRDNMKAESLLSSMDSLKKADPAIDTALEKEKLRALQTNLQAANESMTDWMHAFDPVQENKEPAEITSYLQEELKKIQALKESFVKVEEESKQVLEKYN